MPTFTVRLMGTKFRPPEAREVASNLKPHENVTLVAEPENEYDRNAIRVEVHGEFIGYVQKDMAAALQQYIFWTPDGQEPLTGYVSEDRDQAGLHLIEVSV